MRTLSQVLRETTEKYPNRDAILDPSGITLTYENLSAKVDRLVRTLSTAANVDVGLVGDQVHQALTDDRVVIDDQDLVGADPTAIVSFGSAQAMRYLNSTVCVQDSVKVPG